MLVPLIPSLALENDIEVGAAQIAIKALSRSGGSVRLMRPKRLKYPPRCPSDCQRGEKSALKAL